MASAVHLRFHRAQILERSASMNSLSSELTGSIDLLSVSVRPYLSTSRSLSSVTRIQHLTKLMSPFKTHGQSRDLTPFLSFFFRCRNQRHYLEALCRFGVSKRIKFEAGRDCLSQDDQLTYPWSPSTLCWCNYRRSRDPD